MEIEEDVLDFGGDEQDDLHFESRRSNIYQDMRLRPLSLEKLTDPIRLEGNLLGRVPRTARETYLFGMPGYLYLGLLMKDDEID